MLGLTSRQFRDFVNRYRIRHARLGKLVVVRVDDWYAALERLSENGQSAPANDPVPMTTDEMLARLGKRRAS